MKKFQILFFAVFFSVMATSCEMFDEVDEMFEENGERKISPDQLPANILDYISTNYPNATVLYAEIDPDYTAYYEVEISNGLELYFDQNGNFLGLDDDEDEDEDQKINADQLPAIIMDYISTNYPEATVLYAEIDPDYTAYYEVKLSNGLELYFDQDGNFLGLDEEDEDEEEYKGSGNGEVPQALVDKALAIFNGTVVYNDTYTEDGVQLAEVTIQNEEGARVEFYFVQSTGEVYEIEAEKGPFNYEIEANADWIALSRAIELGCTAANSSDCNILEWELYNKGTQAFYEIDFANGAEVKINAVNGDIISVEFDD